MRMLFAYWPAWLGRIATLPIYAAIAVMVVFDLTQTVVLVGPLTLKFLRNGRNCRWTQIGTVHLAVSFPLIEQLDLASCLIK